MRTIVEQVCGWISQVGANHTFIMLCIIGNKIRERKIIIADSYKQAVQEAEKICRIHDWQLLGVLKAKEFLKLSNYVGCVGWKEIIEWKEGKTTLYYHNCPHCGHQAYVVGKPRTKCTKCNRRLREWKVLNWKDING